MATFIKFTFEILDKQHLTVLREIGRQIGVRAPAAKKKEELIKDILAVQSGEVKPIPISKFGAPPKISVDVSRFYLKSISEEYGMQIPQTVLKDSGNGEEETLYEMEGVLEQSQSGYGFLRTTNYENSNEDVYVSLQNIRKHNLRRGDKIKGMVKPAKQGESAGALQTVISINDRNPQDFAKRKNFDDLIPYYPNERIKLETCDGDEVAKRVIDLFAPIGFGQRGLIVAPPKTGKTTLLKQIATSIEQNYPNAKLIVLLIDERPEEVTDIKRSIKSEVVYSTFDEGAEHHVKICELVINRAKRLVEIGENVIILMDSITRLARAYNSVVESSGKVLSGGLDPLAMQGPKRFFGSARNIEDGGSLTILSTALIDTGSRMDDVVYEEFKGTGNMEIHLSRELSERRIFPAIDIFRSGTRKEELLLNEKELSAVYKLRGVLRENQSATDKVIDVILKTKNNDDLIEKTDTFVKIYKN